MTQKHIGFQLPDSRPVQAKTPVQPNRPQQPARPNPDPRLIGFMNMVMGNGYTLETKPKQIEFIGESGMGRIVLVVGNDGFIHVLYKSPYAPNLNDYEELYAGCKDSRELPVVDATAQMQYSVLQGGENL